MADYKHLIIPRNWNQYINREDWRDLLTKFVEEEANVTVDVGSTTRTDYNSPPQVSNSGTNRNAILNFSIPSGDGIASMEETDIPANTDDPHDNGGKAITLNWDSGKSDQFTIQHGKDGVGIKTIEQTTTNTADGATNEWTVTLTDESKAVISVKNGETGASIQTTTPYYLATSKSTDVTKDEEGWTTTPQQTTDTKKYLWSYVHTEYTDGTQIDSNPVVIGTKGEKGDKGDKGEPAVTVDSQLSTTSTNPVQNKVVTGAIGTLSSLTTTAKTNLVSAINEVNNKASSGSDGIVPTFTYEVDSNQALLNWANNVSGNDYSAVLIRRGTWTSTKGVNLTTSGTKVVVGEAGSKLVFNGVEKGLFYNTTPTISDYWMRNVTVECTASIRDGYGFCYCTNLTNCTGTGIGYSTSNGSGFWECTNLTNCTGTGTVKGTNIDRSNAVGFGGCTNLVNCIGTGRGDTSTSTKVSGNGFYYCTNLTNCTGTGIRVGGSVPEYVIGVGFYGCKRVSGCKKGSTCTDSVFNDSHASFSRTSTYACADTANGGFNDTTN